MSDLVFLVRSYYPKFCAVGYCAYRVQKCLVDEMDVTVIAARNDRSQSLDELHEGARILRIETSSMRRRNALAEVKGRIAAAQLAIVRVQSALLRLLTPVTIDKSLVAAYSIKLNALDPPPRAIVPLVFPFEAVIAALDYKKKNPDTIVIPYLFDDFVDSRSLHVLTLARRLKRQRHIELERRMLSEANAILSMHPLRQHLETYFSKPLLDKVSYLEHPLLFPVECQECRPDDGKALLCFTGSLIAKVRQADYLLYLLENIQPSISVRADFFVMGNDTRKVRTVKLASGVEVVNHGYVPKSEADAAVREADILLNIGEAQGKQVSSKIFEYMATGKPIIHLSYLENDAVSDILEKYPLALCLVQDGNRLDQNVQMMNRFIDQNRRKRISYEEVESLYPEAKPEITASFLIKIIKKATSLKKSFSL